MAVDKITMIHLLVRDMEKAKSFYMDKLGFKATQDYGYEGNRWVVVVPPGGGTYVVLGTKFEQLKLGCIMKLFLSTQDVEEAHKDLKAKGVKPNDEVRNDSWGKWFSVNDPDGNYWFIVQS